MLPNAGTISVILIVNVSVLYSLNFIVPHAADMLGLVTANTVLWNKFVWNVITAAFYEESYVRCIIDIICILYVTPTRHVEYLPVDQFAIYLFVCVFLSSITTSTYCLIRLLSTGREAMVLEPIYGAAGVIIALTMYSRKHLGRTAILGLYQKNVPIKSSASVAEGGDQQGGNDSSSGAGSPNPILVVLHSLTFNNLPPIIVVALLFCWFIRERWLALDAPFAISSLLISWSYLRFFYVNEDGTAGTPGEEFAFVAMFPQPLHVVLVPLTTAFYNLTALTGLFPPLPTTTDTLPLYNRGHHLRGPRITEQNSSGSSGIVLQHDSSFRSTSAFATAGPGTGTDSSKTTEDAAAAAAATASANAITERRRAKALKLLDAKMTEMSSGSTAVAGAASAGGAPSAGAPTSAPGSGGNGARNSPPNPHST